MLSRDDQLRRLQDEKFDLLVIGGGATGAGIALDGATRGLKVAIVDGGDFSSGTSSRSTKLLHGGVRYLEKAFWHCDIASFQLVKEGLRERATLLGIAPHLTRVLPMMIPVFTLFDAAYYWLGIKVYDWLAGKKKVGTSHFISRAAAREAFPKISRAGMKGGVLFFDGQFDDARMNVALVLTAQAYGAVAANYLKVTGFNEEAGKIVGVTVTDRFTGAKWKIQADCCVNAAGPSADAVRGLADPALPPMLVGSVGTHLVLDKTYTESGVGVFIPKTDDGRILAFLPWQGGTLVGTTDLPTKNVRHPKPSEEEIAYLLNHVEKYLGIHVDQSEVLAAWAGVRPLLEGKASATTAQLSRDFKIELDNSGLCTIVGGKWTSYRRMAEKTLDTLVKSGAVCCKGGCVTPETPLIGAAGYSDGLAGELSSKYAFSEEVSEHLSQAYGGRAKAVARLAAEEGLTERMIPEYPYIWAEVLYAVRAEMACTACDVLSRRTRLAALNQQAAMEVLPRVVELMSQELGWDAARQKVEREQAIMSF